MLVRKAHEIPSVVTAALRLSADQILVIECGGHDGTTARNLHAWCGGRKPQIYVFEPDPRNIRLIRERGLQEGTTLVEAAVGAIDGESELHLSGGVVGGEDWTYSSSIRKPKKHLEVYPWVRFGETVRVKTVKLDTFCEKNGIDRVDFVWADIQGAERDMVQGGQRILRTAKLMFLEQDAQELYEGQWTYGEMVAALVPQWAVAALFPNDVLFYNTEMFSENPVK